MSNTRKHRVILYILLSVLALSAVIIGSVLGLALSVTKNIQDLEDLDITESALPTQIIDINGNIITEFFPPDEKRDLVSLDEVPDHLIYALLTREDREFYSHKGFNLKRIIKAALDILVGKYSGGGSTITQQVAKNRYTDGAVTMQRKLVELWWAMQLERRYSKDEILEFYINEIPFGHGTNGVEAASRFYFGHSVRDITLAEAVLLVNAVANWTLYSPLRNPDIALERQEVILDQMVELGYVTQEERDDSFRQYWDNYDFTRHPNLNVTSTIEDKAPWFSFYVQEQLNEMFLGSENVYKGGLKVYTTLDLGIQQYAQNLMQSERNRIDSIYKSSSNTRVKFADDNFNPVIELLSLNFNLPDVRTADRKQKQNAKNMFHSNLNPVLDLLSLGFNLEDTRKISQRSYQAKKEIMSKTEVEGAMICLDSSKGYIVAMVGGSKEFSSRTNMFNRAVYAQVSPGSAFKPLYYSAAIKSGMYTPASVLPDRPVVFFNDDGTTYTPLNYVGKWSPNGTALLKDALARSLNIPSLQILDGIGFDAAIEQASKMLGITDPVDVQRIFPRKYPLGLGTLDVSPLQMARAFATFPNEGKMVTPIAIRYIEDRNGTIIYEPEKKLRTEQKRLGKSIQLLSPQEDFIMVDILKGALRPGGTLYSSAYKVGGFDFPVAGKTGTTQNWSDAWAIGFSTYYTTAVWFGFDTPGVSLGINLSGAAAAGPVWAQFMKHIHTNLQPQEFTQPTSGLVEVEICKVSGLLPDLYDNCKGNTYKQWFIRGTEPHETCNFHKKEREKDVELVETMKQSLHPMLESIIDLNLDLELNLDLDPDQLLDPDFLKNEEEELPLNSTGGNGEIDALLDDENSLFSGDVNQDMDLAGDENPLFN